MRLILFTEYLKKVNIVIYRYARLALEHKIRVKKTLMNLKVVSNLKKMSCGFLSVIFIQFSIITIFPVIQTF